MQTSQECNYIPQALFKEKETQAEEVFHKFCEMFEGTPLGDFFFNIIYNGLSLYEGRGEVVGNFITFSYIYSITDAKISFNS